MKSALWNNIKLFIWLSVLTGLVYPLILTGFGNFIFNTKSQGDFIYVKGEKRGARLIGQQFKSERYFWGRPSAVNYSALPSGGSQLGPTSRKLKEIVEKRKSYLQKAHQAEEIPAELLFASGSGLDPHLTRLALDFQFERVGKARGWNEEEKQKVREQIDRFTQPRFLGFIGEAVVNVLELNIALDEMEKNHKKIKD